MSSPGMQSRKPRGSANPAVGIWDYLKALRDFQARIGLERADDLEPNLVSEHRFVRPVHVIRLARLLHVLMDIGCVNCMVLPKCFELAVVRWLSTCPLRVSESGGLADRAESFALRLTSHVQAVFAMLRILHHEDQKSQLQKTMPFRKKASAADWVVIESLLHRVVPSPPWYSNCDAASVASSQTSPRADSQASPRTSRPSENSIWPANFG